MFWEFLIIAIGSAIIIALSEVVIRSVLALASHFRASPGLVGLTAMSIGTSIPEIMTHIAGSVAILHDPTKMDRISRLVIGGNIGSDIFQQNFLLAIVALIASVVVLKKDLKKMIGALTLAAILVMLFSLDGVLSRLEGGLLLLAYIGYLWYLKRHDSFEQVHYSHLESWQVASFIALVVTGFAVMGFIAQHVLGAAENLVDLLPVSASMLGLLILGTASALPELATSLLAIRKGEKGMSAGILIGSNVTNPLFALGLGALISSYSVSKVIVFFDLPFKIATAVLIYWFLARHHRLRKVDAVILLSLFFGYLVARFLFFPVDL